MGDIPGLPDVLGDIGDSRILARRGTSAPATMSIATQVRDHRQKNLQVAEANIVNPVPGVADMTPKLLPLGSAPIQFTPTSGLTLRSQADVFRPFQAYVLKVTIVRSVAGSGGAITITGMFVGSTNQRPNGQPLSAEIWTADAVNVTVKMTPAEPGVPIFLDFTASAAPGAGETVDVVPTWFGLTIQQ